MSSAPYVVFGRRVRAVLDARRRLLASLPGNGSDRVAREYAIQGLYLVGVRSFETFLEDQIFQLATEKSVWKSRLVSGTRLSCKLRMKENRPTFVREIIFQGKDYADYLPYERTIKIANQLFVGGRPFSLLDASQKSSLNRCLRVRHYIAHDSDYAARVFANSVRAVKPFRMKQPTPIHYLQENIRSGVSFFEHDLATLYSVAGFLS